MKKTVLDENASIYQKRDDDQSDRERLKEMSTGQKLSYFKDYYLIRTIVIIAAVVAVIIVGRSILFPDPDPLVSISVVNSWRDMEVAETLQADLLPLLAPDPSSKDRVDIYDNFSFKDAAGIIKLQAFSATNQLDLLTVFREDCAQLAHEGFFMDLRDVLTKEELDRWEDRLWYAVVTDPALAGAEAETDEAYSWHDISGDPDADPMWLIMKKGTDLTAEEREDRENVTLAGISALPGSLVSDLVGGSQPPLVGIAANTKRPENSVLALRFLMGEDGSA